ncbi:hypothetical protein H5410_046577 [Solanum commersonii]|uniref:Uncharacterized protein n=1 Tax=Solanum commersonii TaxID=4109 RepID=A0A9J5XEU0_SOLCO|nr:hypothetical protein H5410_046577 [Solanum commersonii]
MVILIRSGKVVSNDVANDDKARSNEEKNITIDSERLIESVAWRMSSEQQWRAPTGAQRPPVNLHRCQQL